MLLASVDSIREVILFPTLRPEFTPPDGGPGGAPRPLLTPTPELATLDGASVVALPDTSPSADTIPPPAAEGGRFAARVLAALTGVAGLLQLLAVAARRAHPDGPARPAEGVLDPFWLPVAGHVVSVVVGLLLLVLADQLRRRKQPAWRVAAVLYAVGAVAHVLKGPHPVALLLCVGMLVALVWFRDDFRAPADPPSLLRLVRFVPTYLVAVLAFGAVTLWTERSRMSPELTPSGVLETVVAGLVGLDGPYTYRAPFFAVFFPDALVALGVVGLVVLVVLLFRPLAARREHTDYDWAHATRLVHTYGWDTLAYFALRSDKSFFFSRDGEAFLAYTYIGGYALVAGDPIGQRDSVVAVLDEFLAMCDERAWTPALLAVREANMPLYSLAWLLGALPRRRGDHRLPPVHPRRPGTQEPARRRAPGRTDLHLPDAPRVARLGRRWSRSSTRSARGGAASARSAASRCRSRRTSSVSGRTRVPALRRARRARRPRRLPAGRARLRAVVRLHARPHAP